MARPKKAESIRRTSNVMVRFSSIEYELVAGYTTISKITTGNSRLYVPM